MLGDFRLHYGILFALLCSGPPIRHRARRDGGCGIMTPKQIAEKVFYTSNLSGGTFHVDDGDPLGAHVWQIVLDKLGMKATQLLLGHCREACAHAVRKGMDCKLEEAAQVAEKNIPETTAAKYIAIGIRNLKSGDTTP